MFNIDRNLYVILLLLFYIPAIYRMAILISIDNGPLNMFYWIRTWVTGNMYKAKNPYSKEVWQNLEDGVNCTDCTGVWSAIILGGILILSLYWDYASIIIFAIGGAGFQHYITNREDELIV